MQEVQNLELMDTSLRGRGQKTVIYPSISSFADQPDRLLGP